MTAAAKKKLIEVALPLDAINAASAREKSVRHIINDLVTYHMYNLKLRRDGNMEMFKRISGLFLIVIAAAVAVHTIVEPLYHTSSEAQMYSSLKGWA